MEWRQEGPPEPCLQVLNIRERVVNRRNNHNMQFVLHAHNHGHEKTQPQQKSQSHTAIVSILCATMLSSSLPTVPTPTSPRLEGFSIVGLREVAEVFQTLGLGGVSKDIWHLESVLRQVYMILHVQMVAVGYLGCLNQNGIFWQKRQRSNYPDLQACLDNEDASQSSSSEIPQ